MCHLSLPENLMLKFILRTILFHPFNVFYYDTKSGMENYLFGEQSERGP